MSFVGDSGGYATNIQESSHDVTTEQPGPIPELDRYQVVLHPHTRHISKTETVLRAFFLGNIRKMVINKASVHRPNELMASPPRAELE